MANLNLDFSNVAGGKLLDEGTYAVTIESVEEKVSASGKNMLLVRFRENDTQTAIFENYVLQENCLWKLKELLLAAGIDCEGITDFDTEDLVGLTFTAKIVQDDYNDSKVNRIKKIFAA